VPATSRKSWRAHRRSAWASAQRADSWKWSSTQRSTYSAIDTLLASDVVSATPLRTSSPKMGASNPAAADWNQRSVWLRRISPKNARTGPSKRSDVPQATSIPACSPSTAEPSARRSEPSPCMATSSMPGCAARSESP
jgi:hypothetical protein